MQCWQAAGVRKAISRAAYDSSAEEKNRYGKWTVRRYIYSCLFYCHLPGFWAYGRRYGRNLRIVIRRIMRW